MHFLYRLIGSAIAVFVASYLLSGVEVNDALTALIVAIVLGIVNTFVKPIVFVLTLPITILTLGLFAFVINALMVLLTAYLVSGFNVVNLWWAVLFSIVVSLVTSLLGAKKD